MRRKPPNQMSAPMVAAEPVAPRQPMSSADMGERATIKPTSALRSRQSISHISDLSWGNGEHTVV